MSKSTIDKIRKIELETAKAEENAAEGAKVLAQKTKSDIDMLIKEAIARAQDDANKILEESAGRQEELIGKQSEETAKEVEAMRKGVEEKKAEAVRAILGIVLE